VETESGDCLRRFRGVAGLVGHVQIASMPERAEPDGGALDYAALLPALVEAGYGGAFGCEYRPTRDPSGALAALRARLAA
jgi:hydroxypyruvate isomerase